MDTNYPRLSTPLLLALVCALVIALAWKGAWLPDWVRTFLIFVAVALGMATIFTLVDWLAGEYAQRIYEIYHAQTAPAIELALAVKGLSTNQLELVRNRSRVEIIARVTDDAPIFAVRCPGMDVPWDIVSEFVNKSAESYPHLWPVRHFGNERAASAITALILQMQDRNGQAVAVAAAGPFAAKLTMPLDEVARRLGVELEGVRQ